MINLQKETYDAIESNLKFVAFARRSLIVMQGESEEIVDKFISEVSQREIDRTRNMNEIDIMLEILTKIKLKNQRSEVMK